MLQNYGQRLVRLAEEAESAMRELRDLRRGRVLIGANEAAVHTLLPLMARFRQQVPDIAIDVRRVPARQIAVEVQQGSLDFGALTFRPSEAGLLEVPVGSDELVLLLPPSHRAREAPAGVDGGRRRRAGRRAQRSVAGARARAAAVRGASHRRCNMVIALPSLDGIKRAVELEAGGRDAAAALRDHRDRQRPARGGAGCRAFTQAPGDARLPEKRIDRTRPTRFFRCAQEKNASQ